jgi:hypothetical protein
LTHEKTFDDKRLAAAATRVWLIVAVCCGCLDFVTRIARAALDVLRLALARDRLGSEPAPSTPSARKPLGVIHVLFVSREPLGFEPVPPRAARSVLRTIFAPEKLPLDPEPAPATRRRSRLAALFAPEKLDDSP